VVLPRLSIKLDLELDTRCGFSQHVHGQPKADGRVA